MTLNHENSDDL